MWKIWLALGLAAVAAAITIGMGILHQARFSVILQRTIISVFVAGCGGYILNLFMERIGLPYLLRENISAEQVQVNGDSLAEEEQETPNEEVSEVEEKKEFAPFTTDNLNRVSPPNG